MGVDWSSPSPITDGLPPDGGVWRRLCREPEGNGTRKGARALVSGRRLDTAGNRRFSGAPMVLGADVWRESETAEALILMGAWCGAYLADTTRKKTGMRLRPQVGSGVCQTERNRKKWSKVAQGGVLPLDGSLLMGAFPIRPLSCEGTSDIQGNGYPSSSQPPLLIPLYYY